MNRTRKLAATTVAMVVFAGACAGTGDRDVLRGDPPGTTAGPTTTASPGTTAAPTTTEAPRPRPPEAPRDAATAAAEIAATEAAIRDPATPTGELIDAARRNQVAYRVWSHRPDWDDTVLGALPDGVRSIAERHLAARRELLSMHTRVATRLPAWEIIEPEPPDALLAAYREAEAATGIEWQYLAAINLIETGFGRIHGVSSAGALGPMQFMPTTWAEPGIGEGDVHDPYDAIAAAARYLVRRGGPGDMDRALWGYNNHNAYVRSIRHYADLMAEDERAFLGLYHWVIYFATEHGDVWLPVGYARDEPIDAAEHLAEHPGHAVPRG